MKECYLYKKLKNNLVQCQICNHFCQIPPGKTGICGVRLNKGGKLYALNYSKAISANVDPIEKKPLYHFLPGTLTYTIATVGCNFRCTYCQNWQISQVTKNSNLQIPISNFPGEYLPPKRVVEEAKKNNCPSISYSYTEPTIFFEWAYDTMKLAQREGLKNIWVSNGYFSDKVFKKIESSLDAINIDFKSFSDEFYQKQCGAKLKPVLENLQKIYKYRSAAAPGTPLSWTASTSKMEKKQRNHKIHLEITTLIIPGFNDSEKELSQISHFIADKLGPEVPWHLSRFFPAYKMQDIVPTPIKTLQKAKQIGQKTGLKNIYLGNI